jgi:hypothetical protein
MRFTYRGALVALTAVLAMSLGSVASASAAECPGSGEGVVLCSGGHVLEGTFPYTGTQTNFEITFVGWGAPTCTTAKSSGQLVAAKSSVEIKNLVVEWSSCSLAGHASCKVKPIVFGSKGTGLNGIFAGTGEVSLSAAEGELFAEVSITGCEQENVFKVKGHQVCSLPGSTTEAVTHTVSCTTGGSHLKWGAKEATLRSHEEFKLTSGKAFSLQKS